MVLCLPRDPSPAELPIMNVAQMGPRAGPMDTCSMKTLALQTQKTVPSKVDFKDMVVMFVENTSRDILNKLYHATK